MAPAACTSAWATFKRRAGSCKSAETQLQAANTADGTAMKKVLGAWDLAMLGIGGIIGAGIFVTTGVAARGRELPDGSFDGAGPAVTVSFALASVVAFLCALCYTEFATDVPVAGGAYVYISITLGELASWIVGTNLILEYILSSAAVARGWTSYFAEAIGLSPSDLRVPLGMLELDFPSAGIVLILSALLSRGIKEGAVFNLIVTAINLVSIAIILVGGWSHIDPDNYTPFNPNGWQAMSGAASIVFFSFIGFDTVASTAEEVKRPSRDLPIGILVSLGVCTVLYVLMALTLTGMVPWYTIDPDAPFGTAFLDLGSGWLSILVSVGAVTGITTSLLVSLIGGARVMVTLGRDHLVPKLFARVHPRFGTPAVSQMITGTASALIAMLIDIELLAKMVNIGTLFVFFCVSFAVLIRRYTGLSSEKTPLLTVDALMWRMSLIFFTCAAFAIAVDLEAEWWALLVIVLLAVILAATFYRLPVRYTSKAFSVPLAPFVCVGAMGGTVWLIASLGWISFMRFFIWLILSLLMYVFYGMHKTDAAASVAVDKQRSLHQSDGVAASADEVQLAVVDGAGPREDRSGLGGAASTASAGGLASRKGSSAAISQEKGDGHGNGVAPSAAGQSEIQPADDEESQDSDDIRLHRGADSSAY